MNMYSYIEQEIEDLIQVFDSDYSFIEAFSVNKWKELAFPYIFMAISDRRPDADENEDESGESIDSEITLDMFIGLQTKRGVAKTSKELMYDAVENMDIGLNRKILPILSNAAQKVVFKQIKIELITMRNFNLEGKILFEFVVTIPFNRQLT